MTMSAWAAPALRRPIPLFVRAALVSVLCGLCIGAFPVSLGQILSADGFKVYKRTNADRDDYVQSVVRGHSEDAPEVVLVRQAFENIAFEADGRIDRSVDVIIGEEQPAPVAAPQFGVPLPDGTACLPDLNLSSTDG